jgi:hypothetical protein
MPNHLICRKPKSHFGVALIGVEHPPYQSAGAYDGYKRAIAFGQVLDIAELITE